MKFTLVFIWLISPVRQDLNGNKVDYFPEVRKQIYFLPESNYVSTSCFGLLNLRSALRSIAWDNNTKQIISGKVLSLQSIGLTGNGASPQIINTKVHGRGTNSMTEICWCIDCQCVNYWIIKVKACKVPSQDIKWFFSRVPIFHTFSVNMFFCIFSIFPILNKTIIIQILELP